MTRVAGSASQGGREAGAMAGNGAKAMTVKKWIGDIYYNNELSSTRR